jgi:hypothetical protein
VMRVCETPPHFSSLLHNYFPSCTRNPQPPSFSHLSATRPFNIVATNRAHAFCIPLSRHCATTPRDKAHQAAPATWPAAAIFGVHPPALQIARVEPRRRSGQFEFRLRLSADNPLRSSRAIFPSPHGNKRKLRLARRDSTADLLRSSSEIDASVLRRRSCASKCDSRVAGLRVALRFVETAPQLFTALHRISNEIVC